MTPQTPIVSIVGRPNVGKSSLFNRILGKREAVIEKREGTTRDRIERLVKIHKKDFILVDTGGFLPDVKDELALLIKNQIEKAVKSSDILLFVCDGETGVSPLDMDLANLLRKSGKKIILAINKIDNEKRKENIYDFYELGLGEPFPISCLHAGGIKELLYEVTGAIPERSKRDERSGRPIKVSICGRPNVGKSSFLNKVLNEERVIVHEKPGTTRDSIHTYFEKDGVLFLLIDTAGIRHKRKVKTAVDVYSIMRAKQSIDESDVVLLLIDGMEGVAADDIKIFDYIVEKQKGCVIVVNKWDLVKGIEMSRYGEAVRKRIPAARNFPIVFVSAKTGRNVMDAFGLVATIKTNSELRIDRETLSRFLCEINPQGAVKISRRRMRPRFYSMAESTVFPKEFVIFVDDVRAVTDFHTAFIENRLREAFPLFGVPVKLVYKRR